MIVCTAAGQNPKLEEGKQHSANAKRCCGQRGEQNQAICARFGGCESEVRGIESSGRIAFIQAPDCVRSVYHIPITL